MFISALFIRPVYQTHAKITTYLDNGHGHAYGRVNLIANSDIRHRILATSDDSDLSSDHDAREDASRIKKEFGGGGGALRRPLFDPARLGGTGKAGAGS